MTCQLSLFRIIKCETGHMHSFAKLISNMWGLFHGIYTTTAMHIYNMNNPKHKENILAKYDFKLCNQTPILSEWVPKISNLHLECKLLNRFLNLDLSGQYLWVDLRQNLGILKNLGRFCNMGFLGVPPWIYVGWRR